MHVHDAPWQRIIYDISSKPVSHHRALVEASPSTPLTATAFHAHVAKKKKNTRVNPPPRDGANHLAARNNASHKNVARQSIHKVRGHAAANTRKVGRHSCTKEKKGVFLSRYRRQTCHSALPLHPPQTPHFLGPSSVVVRHGSGKSSEKSRARVHTC